jgi:hypothetical protein
LKYAGSKVGILQDHPTAGSDEAEITGKLVRGAPQRPDLEPAMHEVEGVRLKPTIEEIVVGERDIAEALHLGHESAELRRDSHALTLGASDFPLLVLRDGHGQLERLLALLAEELVARHAPSSVPGCLRAVPDGATVA